MAQMKFDESGPYQKVLLRLEITAASKEAFRLAAVGAGLPMGYLFDEMTKALEEYPAAVHNLVNKKTPGEIFKVVEAH